MTNIIDDFVYIYGPSLLVILIVGAVLYGLGIFDFDPATYKTETSTTITVTAYDPQPKTKTIKECTEWEIKQNIYDYCIEYNTTGYEWENAYTFELCFLEETEVMINDGIRIDYIYNENGNNLTDNDVQKDNILRVRCLNKRLNEIDELIDCSDPKADTKEMSNQYPGTCIGISVAWPTRNCIKKSDPIVTGEYHSCINWINKTVVVE